MKTALSMEKNDVVDSYVNYHSIQHIIPNTNVITIPYFTIDTVLSFSPAQIFCNVNADNANITTVWNTSI